MSDSIFPTNNGAYLAGLVAAAAGFAGDGLITAIAVAGGESTFDANAWNDKPSETPRGEAGPCVSVGFWQINYCPGRDDADPNRGAGDPKTLLDPIVNARAAFAISSGGANWQPWGAYTSGAHVKYLEDARKVVNLLETDGGRKAIQTIKDTGKLPTSSSGSSLSIGGITIPIPNPLDVAKSAAGLIPNPLDWGASIVKLLKFVTDPKNWLRVLAANVGGALVIVGIAILIADQNPQLTQAAATAAIA